jgi:hypothetical protein
MRKIKYYLSNTRKVYLTFNQEMYQNKINSNNNNNNNNHTSNNSDHHPISNHHSISNLNLKKINEDREKRSLFECGFDPKKLRTATFLITILLHSQRTGRSGDRIPVGTMFSHPSMPTLGSTHSPVQQIPDSSLG